jgi:hypothetical protein
MPQNLELSDVRISGTSEKIRINAFEVFDGADAERGWSNLTILKNWELLAAPPRVAFLKFPTLSLPGCRLLPFSEGLVTEPLF